MNAEQFLRKQMEALHMMGVDPRDTPWSINVC